MDLKEAKGGKGETGNFHSSSAAEEIPGKEQIFLELLWTPRRHLTAADSIQNKFL